VTSETKEKKVLPRIERSILGRFVRGNCYDGTAFQVVQEKEEGQR